MKGTYFISGIDTNVGKSYVTGILARNLMNEGVNVITQKMIQTGNGGYSEDIELQRQIMKCEPFEGKKDVTTGREIFS